MKNRFEIKGDLTVIFLNRKKGYPLETLVDTHQLKRLAEFPNTWCAAWNENTQSFYCYGKIQTVEGRKTVLLHRWLLQCVADVHVDHFDNDTLNNRDFNLRIATPMENHQNRKGAQTNSHSGVRGVCFNKRKNKWQAYLKVGSKRTHLGYFVGLHQAEKTVTEARKNNMPFSKEAVS